jgi:pyrimidine-specific ribonucleoside hydrolase
VLARPEQFLDEEVLMRRAVGCVALLLLSGAVLGHEPDAHPELVIDTDMGLDDAVALALALQSPDVDVVAIVACEGASGGDQAVFHLERLLDRFNRSDVALFAPAPARRSQPVPAFRSFAEDAVGAALPGETKSNHRPFSPDAYISPHNPVVVVLGPLTNLAAALQARPALTPQIAKVILPGLPDPQKNWNLRYDPDAWAAVKASGVCLEFVVPSTELRKPPAWQQNGLAIGQGTSIGEGVIRRLLSSARVREHYLSQWPGFSDELALLYCAQPEDFDASGCGRARAPRDAPAVLELFTRSVSEGRQYPERVVLTESFPSPDMLQPDVRERAAAILARNGQTEWFVQLMTNELHDHLGVYSVLGAKMGLRAAELLDAPPHAMQVTSHSAAQPPVSCLNDGVIVSTGSTPGRALFRHVPGAAGSTRVEFSYNGRDVTLSIKPEYRERIAAEIKRLRTQYGLERPEYWDGVRRFALDAWENWHRRDLFEVTSGLTGD